MSKFNYDQLVARITNLIVNDQEVIDYCNNNSVVDSPDQHDQYCSDYAMNMTKVLTGALSRYVIGPQ